MAERALCRQAPKVGAVCPNRARTDLRGGRGAIFVPTAIGRTTPIPRKSKPMPRYVAFLRGVSPMNAKMPALKKSFETEGFSDVRTLLSSGNVVFNARSSSPATLERRAEKAMQSELGHSFVTIVRSAEYLQDLVQSEPFAKFDLPSTAKPVITFLRRPAESKLGLPIEQDGASILAFTGSEVLAAYVPSPKGPVFMSLLERTFGTDITTRTLGTVRKCAWA